MSKKNKKQDMAINYGSFITKKEPSLPSMQVIEMDLGYTEDSGCPNAGNPYAGISNYYEILNNVVPTFLGFTYLGIIAQVPIISAALKILPAAAVKNWVKLSSSSSGIKIPDLEYKQSIVDKKYNVRDKVKEYLRYALNYGGALMYFNVLGQNINMAKPFNIDSVERGSFLGMVNMDPLQVTADINTNMSNPLSEDYFEPVSYLIPGSNIGTVHKSYFVKCVPEPVAPILRPTYRFFGISLAQKLLPYAQDNVAACKELPQLLKTKRQKVLSVDTTSIVESESTLMGRIDFAQYTSNNYNMMLLYNGGGDPNTKETLTQLDTSLTDVSSTIDTSFNVCAAIAGIPVSKLTGAVSSSGLGNAGDFDKNSWHETVSEFQESNMRLVLEHFYKIAFLSEFGLDIEGINVVFNSISDETELENAEIELKEAEVIEKLEKNDIITKEEGKENLSNKVDNDFNLKNGTKEVLYNE